MTTSYINLNSKATLVNNTTVSFPLSFIYTSTGSNYISNNMNVFTGSWQTIDQSNNADFRIGFFENTDTTASIYIGVNGTGSYTILQPGDPNVLTYSGSCSLYTKAINTTGSFAVLNYLVSER